MATWAGVERVKKIFKDADTDCNGSLSKDELKAVFQKVSDWDDETIDALIAQCDYNKDGSLQIREFVDFVFRGIKRERQAKDDKINLVRLMAMHSAYYDDLKDRVHNYLQDHGINPIDFNWEDEWPDALPFCQENHVDILSLEVGVLRMACDKPELWYQRDKWVEDQDIPEDRLFEVMPWVKEIIDKSKNPAIALQIIWKPAGSPEAGVSRMHESLRQTHQGIKEKLKNTEERFAAAERFKERYSSMQALIEASEAAQKDAKAKDIAAFKPLFEQIAQSGKWEEAKAQKVLDHMVRGNLYTETWYIEEFTEGSVQKSLEKIGVEMFEEEEMRVLTDFAFEHNELAKTVRMLAKKTGWDLKDQQQVVHKLRRVGCVHPRPLQVAIKNGTLNKSLSKAKFLPFGDASMEILEGWAALYAASTRY